MRDSTRRTTAFLASVALCLLAQCLPALGAARDLTFFLVSDVHAGMQYKDSKPPITAAEYEQHITDTLDVIATIPGKPWPKGTVDEAGKDLGPVGRPSGLIVAGDLTQSRSAEQWKAFDRLFPWQGLAPKRFPVFAGAGNHDAGSKTAPVRDALRARNQAMLKAGLLSTLSPDGLHSAWVWQGVHFVNVNLYAGDAPQPDNKPGSMRDPEGSLTFLRTYLAKNAPAPTPVVIIQHFGLEKSTWWGQDERRAFYEAITNYNVVAILHGHTHAITHLQFPGDDDLKLFGKGGPRFDCFSAGAFKQETKKGEPWPGWRHPCECYVFHLTDHQFLAAHYTGGTDGWNTGPGAAGLTVVKELLPKK
jgi:cytolysin (calcineurin-like family phosphatase)